MVDVKSVLWFAVKIRQCEKVAMGEGEKGRGGAKLRFKTSENSLRAAAGDGRAGGRAVEMLLTAPFSLQVHTCEVNGWETDGA